MRAMMMTGAYEFVSGDMFKFQENYFCRIVNSYLSLAKKSGIPVYYFPANEDKLFGNIFSRKTKKHIKNLKADEDIPAGFDEIILGGGRMDLESNERFLEFNGGKENARKRMDFLSEREIHDLLSKRREFAFYTACVPGLAYDISEEYKKHGKSVRLVVEPFITLGENLGGPDCLFLYRGGMDCMDFHDTDDGMKYCVFQRIPREPLFKF